MAIIIDEPLSAEPKVVRLPRAEIDLNQTLHTIPSPEHATITYELDGRHAIFFETSSGLAKKVKFEDDIPCDPKQRTDPVVLIESGDTGMAEISITQLINGIEEDSVLLAVENVH